MAITNLQQFTVRIRESKGELREKHQKRTRAGALYALQNVIFGTRVDTGRARGNWQVSEGDGAEVDYSADPNRFDVAGRLGNRDTFAEATGAVLATSGQDIIWIHNGVPYINVLEGMDHMVRGAAEALKTWLQSKPLGGES